jgi:hypothetical protein
MQEKQTTDAISFSNDLNRLLKRLALKHNVNIPAFNIVNMDDFYYMQLCAHKSDPRISFVNTYIKNKDDFGLKTEWLNKTFVNKKTGRSLILLGMDLSLGDNCLRLLDQSNIEHSMSPSSFIIMVKQSGY